MLSLLWMTLFAVVRVGHQLTVRTGDPLLTGCHLAEVGKVGSKTFLKMECRYNSTLPVWRCPFSDEYYWVTYDSGCMYMTYNTACTDDAGFYQNCGHTSCNDFRTVNGNYSLFCGAYVCSDSRTGKVFGGTDQEKIYNCNGRPQCSNTDIDEHFECTGYNETYTCKDALKTKIDKKKQCNHKCDCYFCDEEAFCNNQMTGVFCQARFSGYVAPDGLCDKDQDCRGSEDELCPDSEVVSYCKPGLFENKTINSLYRPLTRNMSCPIIGSRVRKFYVCDDLLDQVNCTDTTKVALTCTMKGHQTTVSKFALCLGIPLCDDHYENICAETEGSCLIHKSRICDGNDDCSGASDESPQFCSSLSQQSCTRRVARDSGMKVVAPIPMAWVFDGVNDCVEGTDEEESYWVKCGKETRYIRYQDKNTLCSDVFICPKQNGIVGLDNLCDKIQSCPGENEICIVSRNQVETTDILPSEGTVKLVIGTVNKGLHDLRFLMKPNMLVISTLFMGLPNNTLYNSGIPIRVPQQRVDCSSMYGERKVFMSCLGLCSNSTCPLRPVPHDTCINKPFQRRLYSITTNNTLSILSKVNGTYINDIFPCDNKACVTYDKVCNLVDDCGDASDEERCDNHFQCLDKSQYLPLSSMCDGKLDCLDFSDECSEKCGATTLLGSPAIALVSWFIGVCAIIFNSIALASTLYGLKKTKTFNGALNKILVILISCSDFVMGSYLLAVAREDHRAGGSYCQKRFLWLTSSSCFMLGIVSTIATQTSLFAMTALSLFRVFVLGSLIPAPLSSTSSKIKLVVIPFLLFFIPSLLAVTPILPMNEDYFVNGLYYHENPLFTASVNKAKHTEILQSYLGRFPGKLVSWEKYDQLVQGMFTSDYGGVQGKRVHFYGNSGVCVFKYLVASNDPQRIYALFILAVNIVCFGLITISYTIINYRSTTSSRQSGANASNRQRALHAKVTALIVTDFLSWIPFTVVCLLHYLGVLDATPYYSAFSVIILPINSVINPILYVNQLEVIREFSRALNRRATSIRAPSTATSSITFGKPFGRRGVQQGARDQGNNLLSSGSNVTCNGSNVTSNESNLLSNVYSNESIVISNENNVISDGSNVLSIGSVVASGGSKMFLNEEKEQGAKVYDEDPKAHIYATVEENHETVI